MQTVRYSYAAKVGRFVIDRRDPDSWDVFFDDERLGSYFTPQQAS